MAVPIASGKPARPRVWCRIVTGRLESVRDPPHCAVKSCFRTCRVKSWQAAHLTQMELLRCPLNRRWSSRELMVTEDGVGVLPPNVPERIVRMFEGRKFSQTAARVAVVLSGLLRRFGHERGRHEHGRSSDERVRRSCVAPKRSQPNQIGTCMHGSPRTFTRLEHVKQAISTFVHAKSNMSPAHSYAICALVESALSVPVPVAAAMLKKNPPPQKNPTTCTLAVVCFCAVAWRCSRAAECRSAAGTLTSPRMCAPIRSFSCRRHGWSQEETAHRPVFTKGEQFS